MSSALVRKSLSLVDPSFTSKSHKKKKHVLDFLPDDKKLAKKISNKSHKAKKINLLTKTNKLTVKEVQHKAKTKENVLKQNLKKLELIKQICTIDLDKEITSQLFKRAVTRRPVQLKSKKVNKKQKGTVFTEEDFKRFEEEYLAS